MQFQKVILIFIFILRSYLVSGECKIILNEVNIENGVIPETQEFMEFKKINCPIPNYGVMQDYFLIMVQEYDLKTKSATIIFSANFIHSQFQPSSNFFIIGNANNFVNPNLEFSSDAVMYLEKNQLQIPRSSKKSNPIISVTF
jgi:hypothetical protein